MDTDRFLSTAQLAKKLGISRIAVYKKIKNGQIKAQKVGRNFVIDKNDLGGLIGTDLSAAEKLELNQAVERTVRDYGETLRLLGDA
jgi:excisionase family DNA binding protein